MTSDTADREVGAPGPARHFAPSASRHRLEVAAVAALLGVGYVVTCLGAVNRSFVDDDWVYLNDLQHPGWIHAAWSWGAGLFRPGLYVWFYVLHGLFGLHPVPYHVATAVVAFVEAMLLWNVATRLGLGRASAVAPAVLLLHASLTPTLVWVSAANSPIAVTLALASISILLGESSAVRLAVAAILFAAGMLTREVIVGAPAIVFVLALIRFRQGRRALVAAAPLVAVDAVYLVLREVGSHGNPNPTGPYHQQITSHFVSNVKVLASFAAEVESYRPAIVHLGELGLGLLLVLGLVLRYRLVALAGLVWMGVGVLPVVFLTAHEMDAYYLDFALPGLGLALAASAAGVLVVLPDVLAALAVVPIAAALAVLGHTAAARQNQSLVTGGAEGEQLLAQVRRAYPHPPPGSTIRVRSDLSPPVFGLVTGEDGMFRVVYGDPRLGVQQVGG